MSFGKKNTVDPPVFRLAHFFLFGLLIFSFIAGPPSPVMAAGLVPCGRSADDTTTPGTNEADRCTICHIVIGGKGIIDYGLKIMTFAAIAVIVAMGVLYIVSTGDEGMMQTAKGGLKAALIGFAVMLAAWLIVNTVLNVLAVKDTDPKNPLFGLRKSGAFTFSCDTTSSVGTPPPGKCMVESLQSIEIQCENGGTDYLALGTDNGERPKSAKIKAVGKYACSTGSAGGNSNTDVNGPYIEKDITNMVSWMSADETVAKVASGTVEAIDSGITSLEATYEGKTSNTMETYVNACPISGGASSAYFLDNEKARSNSSLMSVATVQAQSNVSCKGCSPYKEEPLCKFVDGNKKGDFAIVAVPIDKAVLPSFFGIIDQDRWEQPCSGTILSWGNKNNPSGFDNVVSELRSGVNSASIVVGRYVSDSGYPFALYRVDKPFASDKDAKNKVAQQCPELKNKKLISFAFVQRGEPQRGDVVTYLAYAGIGSGETWYCSGEMSSRIFDHEQLGHAIGALDDEYFHAEGQANLSPHYNCTQSPACKKWQNIGGKSFGECFQGCSLSPSKYFRSSDTSIMRSANYIDSFSPLQTHIIRYRLKNWPSGPSYLQESF
ncbi:MAG: hypothetical protein WAW00_01760 [Candidatus Moraniibacteriota bacterium]